MLPSCNVPPFLCHSGTASSPSPDQALQYYFNTVISQLLLWVPRLSLFLWSDFFCCHGVSKYFYFFTFFLFFLFFGHHRKFKFYDERTWWHFFLIHCSHPPNKFQSRKQSMLSFSELLRFSCFPTEITLPSFASSAMIPYYNLLPLLCYWCTFPLL